MTTTAEIRARYQRARADKDWRMAWFWGRWLFNRRWGALVSAVVGASVGFTALHLVVAAWLR